MKLKVPKSLKNYAGRRVIKQFAESIGWVYLGHVNQHSDEHELIRGFTVSAQHHDAHYCVGTIDSYNALLVQRTDSMSAPGKPALEYRWIILRLQLHTRYHPHVFVTPIAHPPLFYEYFFTKQYHFRRMDLRQWQQHATGFTSRFSVFTAQNTWHKGPDLLAPEITALTAEYFRDIEYEIHGDELYLYVSNQRATAEHLESLVKNGHRLARVLDSATLSE